MPSKHEKHPDAFASVGNMRSSSSEAEIQQERADHELQDGITTFARRCNTILPQLGNIDDLVRQILGLLGGIRIWNTNTMCYVTSVQAYKSQWIE